MKKIAVIACVAFLICGMSIGGYTYYKTPVAYLSLDINPSVELGINAFNKVVSAVGYNEDGKNILEGQNILNSNINHAINILVKSASNKGFVVSNGSTIISVTSATDNASVAARLEKAAEQGANDALIETGDTAVVYKDNVALLRRDEARKLGITPGKLNLIQKLQALDPTITVDQYKDAKVTDIMKKVVELKKIEKTADSSSLTDIKNIEKAVQQSKNNAENNSDNGAVTTSPAKENINTDESNGNNNQKDKDKEIEKESEKESASSSATATTSTSAAAEETVKHPENNDDNDKTQSDENNSDNGTVTTNPEKENAKKGYGDNSSTKDNNNSEKDNKTNNDNDN